MLTAMRTIECPTIGFQAKNRKYRRPRISGAVFEGLHSTPIAGRVTNRTPMLATDFSRAQFGMQASDEYATTTRKPRPHEARAGSGMH
jgi:hypothetical protein